MQHTNADYSSGVCGRVLGVGVRIGVLLVVAHVIAATTETDASAQACIDEEGFRSARWMGGWVGGYAQAVITRQV